MWIKLTTNQKQMEEFAAVYSESKLYSQRTHLPHRKIYIYIFFMHITAQLIATRMLTWRYPVNNKLNTYFTCDTCFCTTSASPHQYNLQARGNKRAAMKIKTRDKTLSWIKNKHKMNEKCSKQDQLCGTQKLHAQRYRQKGDKYTYSWHVFRSDLVSLLAYSMATSTDAS